MLSIVQKSVVTLLFLLITLTSIIVILSKQYFENSSFSTIFWVVTLLFGLTGLIVSVVSTLSESEDTRYVLALKEISNLYSNQQISSADYYSQHSNILTEKPQRIKYFTAVDLNSSDDIKTCAEQSFVTMQMVAYNETFTNVDTYYTNDEDAFDASAYFQNATAVYDLNHPVSNSTREEVRKLSHFVEKNNLMMESHFNTFKLYEKGCRITDAAVNSSRANGQFKNKSLNGRCESASRLQNNENDPCLQLPDPISCILTFDRNDKPSNSNYTCRWIAEDSTMSQTSFSNSQYSCIRRNCELLDDAMCDTCKLQVSTIDCSNSENTECISLKAKCGISDKLSPNLNIEDIETACKLHFSREDCAEDMNCQWNTNPRKYSLSQCAKENRGDQKSFYTLLSQLNFLAMASTSNPGDSVLDLNQLSAQYEVCCDPHEQNANADKSCEKTTCEFESHLGCCGLHASAVEATLQYDNSGMTALCGFNQYQRDYVQCSSNDVEVTSCVAVFDRVNQETTLLDVLQQQTATNSPDTDYVSLRSCINVAYTSNTAGICIPKNSDPYKLAPNDVFRKPSLEERSICASRVRNNIVTVGFINRLDDYLTEYDFELPELKIDEFKIGDELAELTSRALPSYLNSECNDLLLPEINNLSAADFQNREQIFENCIAYRRWVAVPTDFKKLVPASDLKIFNGQLFMKWSDSYPNYVPISASLDEKQNLCQKDEHCVFLSGDHALETFGHEKLGCSRKVAENEIPFVYPSQTTTDVAKCDPDNKICTVSFADGGIVCQYGDPLNTENPGILTFPPINGVNEDQTPKEVTLPEFVLYCFESDLQAFAECVGASVALDFVFGPEAEAVSVPTCAGLNLMNFDTACFAPLLAFNELTGQGCTTNVWKLVSWALKHVDT